MRSDARQRLLAIAGGGLTVKSGVTGVAPLDTPLELQPATPAAWKNTQLDQCVTPVTPRHTSKLEGYEEAAGNKTTGGFRPGVALGVMAAEGVARLNPARTSRHNRAVSAQDRSRSAANGEATKAERQKRVVTQWEGLWIVLAGEWMIGAGLADRAEAQAWADNAEVSLPAGGND